MTPGARISASIDILDRLSTAGAPPADRMLADWGRKNRYAGAKDKAAVAEIVYGVLRRRGQIDWWLLRCQGGLATSRARTIIWLLLGEGLRLSDLETRFTGQRFDPTPLTPAEKRIAVELGSQTGFDLSCQPVVTATNMPEFLGDAIVGLYGEDTTRQLSAHGQEGPVDLRVNILKGTREGVSSALKEEGIDTVSTPLSPMGLRLPERRPLSGTKVFKDGLVEPQDEGSQLAALLVEAKPGGKVVDFCAGAGGKTLALAAAMANSGRIVACDISEARLKRAQQRFKRAGVFNVEPRLLTSERDKWIKRRKAKFDGGFDRVLVDAPCSGSGTWRRNPDQKWSLTPEDLSELTAKQGSILESASRLVSPGGRLIYVTCSILPEENEAQIERFLADNPGFFVRPAGDVWETAVPGVECPDLQSAPYLRLTPADHGTDGFFVAILGRKLVH